MPAPPSFLPRLPPRLSPGFPRSLQILKVFIVNLALWSVLSAMGAGSASSELASHGHTPPYFDIFCGAWKSSAMQAVLGTLLYVQLWRRPDLLEHAAGMAMLYCATLLAFLPFDAMHRVDWSGAAGLPPLAPSSLLGALQTVPPFEWFIDFILVSGTFTVQVALRTWRQGQARVQALERAEKENLQLRLDLEQQHMRGLRAQLEPHFLFNALNAISALVRANDGKTALTAIARLSALLRYALTASARESVSVGEELAFVQDYLALQHLRHGARLQVKIDIADPAVLNAACPPLLLQPLVENALRTAARQPQSPARRHQPHGPGHPGTHPQ